MSTFKERIDNVKSELDSLITYSNETTGKSDSTMSEAIASLVAGFGSSGSSSGYTHDNVAIGTLTTTLSTATANSASYTVTHGLGATPSLIAVLNTQNIGSTYSTMRATVYSVLGSNNNKMTMENTSSGTISLASSYTWISAVNDTTFTISNGHNRFSAGDYIWIAIA